MGKKILIADDERDIVDLVKYNLEKEGFTCFTASNGQEAVEVAKECLPDLILLDIMMPKMDGIEACRVLRNTAGFEKTYITFLTARSEEYSELAGFEAGADDYITKPVKPRVLISRVKAMLKRGKSDDQPEEEIALGDIVINRSTFTVTVRDHEMIFPKKEFELLHLLASKPGKVYTRQAILSKVWGTDVYVVDRTIDVHIRKIREKIGEEKIKTIKGVGYKFEL